MVGTKEGIFFVKQFFKESEPRRLMGLPFKVI